MRTPVAPVSVERHDGGSIARVEDLLVTEEPLEIRLGHGPEHDRKEIRLSVTMRTTRVGRRLRRTGRRSSWWM